MQYFTPASGTGIYFARAAKTIRLHRKGCTNRPFFHLVVTQRVRSPKEQVIEQLGTYDELRNEHNEKIASLNIERINHWLGKGAFLTKPAAVLLGIAGILPIHPRTKLEVKRKQANTPDEASAQN